MRLFKLIGVLMLTLAPIGYSFADNFPKSALPKIIECYAAASTIDIDFVQCIIKKVQEIANPNNYHLRVYSNDMKKAENGKLSIIFYNDAGTMIYCIANEGIVLSIDSCASDRGKPIKSDQEWRLLP